MTAPGLESAPGHDVLILGPGVSLDEHGLAALQYRAHRPHSAGVVVPRLLSAEARTIASSGLEADPSRPGTLRQRHRGAPADWGPAQVRGPVRGATHAVYLTRDRARDLRAGQIDILAICQRAWTAGHPVLYEPEAVARLTPGDNLDLDPVASPLPVPAPPPGAPIIYVTKDTRVGGGQRVIFEHLNRLAARGHRAELWTLDAAPNWFALDVPVRSFSDLDSLGVALEPLEAIKVATWWETVDTIWTASRRHGRAVYLVQDIETSYYPDDEVSRQAVLATYRPEFAYLAGSGWIRDRLADLGLTATLLPPGIDLDRYRPLPDHAREDDLVVAIGRSAPIKNFALTRRAWQALSPPRPRLALFGSEPALAEGLEHCTYTVAPDDAEVNRLLNRATVFLQTSRHEGFCLPLLEAMATGAPVICTDARGNRDFCVDGENCVVVEPSPEAVAGALSRLLDDRPRRARLSDAARATAATQSWPGRIDTLERFLAALSAAPGAS